MHQKTLFKLLLTGVITTFLVSGLFWFHQQVKAAKIASGAFGCGNFSDAIQDAPEGKTVVQMVPARDSGGTTISKSIAIQGGWTRFEGDCEQANQIVTGTVGLREAGFTFTAPYTRSILEHDQAPVLTVDTHDEILSIEHLALNNTGQVDRGGGIEGDITLGGELRLLNVLLNNSTVNTSGGGLYLEIREGSELIMRDSVIQENSSDAHAGGFDIHLYDTSKITIQNSRIMSNSASALGGGGRILMDGGEVWVVNSYFGHNDSNVGDGLYIESIGDMDSEVWIINTQFEDDDLTFVRSGSGQLITHVLNYQAYLPMVTNGATTQERARITSIEIDDNYDYVVEFATDNFEPTLPGQHVHFFFDTVAPEDAGVPGQGPWELYGGSSPFTAYAETDRPPFATHLCVLIANPDHSVVANSGNCYHLPIQVVTE